MCGIAGTFAYGARGAPVDPYALRRMSQRLQRRGPDGHGEYFSPDGRLGLVHRRLAIIDLSDAGAQPMCDPESKNWLVFNGEIYNYDALREDLIARGHVFRSRSDTEVILKLYAQWGSEMLPMLRGMFAFALWDDSRQGLLLARDQFGMKPLYISDDNQNIRFASQVKALLASGEVDTRPDPAGSVGFLLWGSIPEPFTTHRAIRSLPAGSSQWIDRNGAQPSKMYYELARRVEELERFPAPLPSGEAQAMLDDALRRSMRRHLVADVPVGLFLSGGIDSGSLLALMTECGDQVPRTFTLGFREFSGDDRDETPVASQVAKYYGSQHAERYFGRNEFKDHLPHMFDAMDLPSIDGVNTYFVCKAAAESGLKVAISGAGGDELFAGYPDFSFVPKTVRALAALNGAKSLGIWARKGSAHFFRHFASPKYASLLEYGCRVESAYFLSRALFLPWELEDILEPEELIRGLEQLKFEEALRISTPNVPNPRVKLSCLFGSWYMRNQLLRDADWASMAHSLELRLPLVDVELWETVLRLVLSGNNLGKRNLAHSPRLRLPEEVERRPKTGFHVPVREWLISEKEAEPGDRGLRGWAKLVGDEFAGGHSDASASQPELSVDAEAVP